MMNRKISPNTNSKLDKHLKKNSSNTIISNPNKQPKPSIHVKIMNENPGYNDLH